MNCCFTWVLRKGIPSWGTFEGSRKEVGMQMSEGLALQAEESARPRGGRGGEAQLQKAWCIGSRES